MGFSGEHCNSDYNSFSGVKQLRLFFGSVLIWCAVEKAQESSEGKDLTR